NLAAERTAERVAEVAAVVVVVPAGDADAFSQLMLGLGRDVPVVVPLAVAGENSRVDLHGVRIVLPEVLVRNRPALAVLSEVAQVAVGREVMVGVVPEASGRRDRSRDGVRDVAGDVVSAKLGDIAPGSKLERGLAVSLQVVRDAKPGVDVFPTRDVVHGVVFPLAEPGIDWRLLEIAVRFPP